jgi:hypothetical protein
LSVHLNQTCGKPGKVILTLFYGWKEVEYLKDKKGKYYGGKFRMKPSGEKVTPQDVILTPMDLIDRAWDTTDVLMLITPGAAHAVYVMWQAGQKQLLCWYINLQDPIRRTTVGFDTGDHMLEVVFSPDKSNWHWKDEDHLTDAVAFGIFTDEKARQIRSEGERVIKLIRENQSPFCDG